MAKDEQAAQAWKAKYRAQMSRELRQSGLGHEHTRSYLEFKQTFYPREYSLYENACNACEKLLRLSTDKKSEAALAENIHASHLGITPAGALSFAALAPIAAALAFIILGTILTPGNFLLFTLFGVVLWAILLLVAVRIPELIANNMRLRASNQMVQCIFYVVTYMRHNSNLELAIDFAAERVGTPLSLDLKKVLWDVETDTYGTIKESLDRYLEQWRTRNLEFIEAFHLIEGSLYEPGEERRVVILEKALQVMLDETYEKMLHYTHDLKGPVTLLYMLGVVLPILGLIVLPMVASFMTSNTLTPGVLALIIALIYDAMLPILIFYLSKMTLSRRPTGYGNASTAAPAKTSTGTKASAFTFAVSILVVCMILGLFPLWLHATVPHYQDPDLSGSLHLNFRLLGYKATQSGGERGPYGVLASALSVFVVLGLGLGIGAYYLATTDNDVKRRQRGKDLEFEFAGALFQLGNRIGEGVPAEKAFGKVADNMKSTASGDFFSLVSSNITRMGASVEKAIFDSKVGAILFFPSATIESAMRVLVESSKKGPQITAQALINISQYIKDIHRVNERVRDLLTDIVSDMKQQVGLLAPAIAAIVVGITSMIVYILTEISAQLQALQSSAGSGVALPVSLSSIFGDPIPPYFFQIIVGIYIVEIIYILSTLINGIENGSDPLSERNLVGRNLVRGTIVYCTITFIVILVFNALASIILGTLLVA